MQPPYLSINLLYAKDGKLISSEKPIKHIRGDAGLFLSGSVASDLSLAGATAKFTARMILPNGAIGPAVIEKDSTAEGGGEIEISSLNPAVSGIEIYLLEADTDQLDPGQHLVFDFELTLTTVPPTIRTVKGALIVEQDYTY